jgi:outer membrane protein assembly factor BamB
MTPSHKTWAPIAILVVSTKLAPAAVAQDWPQWRGPNRDGATASFRAPTSWPEELTQQWKVDVGLGYATPLLVGDRIYMYTRQHEDEVMMALNADSGETIWRTTYPAPFKMNPATSRHGPGPKSTPTFADGRLFTLGMSGIVTAFDADTGRRLWQKPGAPVQPLYHTAMSPVVDGNLVIIHVGGHDNGALTAFDVATGDVRWSWDGDGPAYGSPMVFELSGTRQVVTFTQENLVGVSVAKGELLWHRPYTTPHTTTCQTPVVYGNTLIAAGRSNGITAFRVVRQGDRFSTENVWHTDEVSLYLANGVTFDGVLFGLSHLNSGQYFGLDLDTGRVLWTSDPRRAENAAIVRAGDTILSLENDAELVVFRNSRSGFEVLARYEVATSETWAQPAISGNRIFVKDVSTLALWTFD